MHGRMMNRQARVGRKLYRSAPFRPERKLAGGGGGGDRKPARGCGDASDGSGGGFRSWRGRLPIEQLT